MRAGGHQSVDERGRAKAALLDKQLAVLQTVLVVVLLVGLFVEFLGGLPQLAVR
jgi:hypothetical protein